MYIKNYYNRNKKSKPPTDVKYYSLDHIKDEESIYEYKVIGIPLRLALKLNININLIDVSSRSLQIRIPSRAKTTIGNSSYRSVE